ncbi:spore germination protein [Paenibacillus sp. IB182496]|uniref:Spore germination protein n=1 Tax=Paenibacillus sabuli TaxID=2772509 RepID=A0A927BRL7_9BACL|nr:spore germination protein [Paenibacillus sabuli]MBD2844193.1 spore germination protein [Paenibacillus sabuli]
MTLENNGEAANGPLGDRLKPVLQQLTAATGESSDIAIRRVTLDQSEGEMLYEGAVVFVEGFTKPEPMIHTLLRLGQSERRFAAPRELLAYYAERVVSEGEVMWLHTWEELLDALLSGHSIVLLDHCPFAIAVGTQDIKARNVEEPNVQSVVRGPREGFTEVLSWNLSMLRRKLASPEMRVEKLKLGKRTRTDTAVVYMTGIADEQVVSEVRRRMRTIDIDGVLESNYIEEFIQDEQITPFPTIYNTERPDTIVANLLEGRVAILVDGTPFALIVPALFTQFFQSSEDYYQRSDFSSLIRMLRFGAFLLALLTPSFYIAITTFHQEMLPTTLLYSLASQRQGVPFPAFVEAAIMEVTFEILREASVRMPRTIGQSMSIVGTLVIGQAAVEAGLVSAAMVIVVSITAISNFVLPAFNIGIAVRMIRFALMLLAASFGLYGVFLGFIGIMLHLASLQSFGVPYMAPMAPFVRPDQKDTLYRVPIPRMFRRPKSLKPQDVIREKKV